MDCNQAQPKLGRYLDDACSVDEQAAVAAHLASCASCREEYESLVALTAGLQRSSPVRVPPELWPAIERRLDARRTRVWRRRGSWAIAAGVILAVTLGTLSLSGFRDGSSEASAAPINFGVILDALPLDAEKAFRKFLILYNARPISPAKAARFAPTLDFALPDTLPGGFRLTGVYAVRFGDTPGIAARYERNGEFLAAIFHPPISSEDFGTHRDYPCVIGKHCGHKVEVGQWKLVHVTDPTTCHCVLSRLSETTELPQILDAVAPAAASARQSLDDHHASP
ncbi:MAG: anti-sigma factor family protein [Phycisphaerae bacterium]